MTLTEESFEPDRRLWCIFAVIGLLNFAASLDATSLSVALPTIAEELHGTAIQAFWAGTSFLIGSTVFQPTFSMASDLFGRKWTLFTAVVAFTVGSIVAAVAQNLTTLLAGRCVQGVGGGGIIALTEVLIADLIPLRERGKWMSFRALTWALGTVIGPIIGGALAESAWRWIFWLNLPFCGIGLIMIPIFMKLKQQPMTMKERFMGIDYLGCFIFTGSLTSFIMPLSWGGIMYPWDAWQTLFPMLLGAAGLVGFVFVEMGRPRPLIPMAIFRTRSIIINYLSCLLHGAILFCILYYLPLYFEAALGYTAVIAGVAILPLTLTVAPLSAIASILVSITGRYRWALWSGWAVTTLGLGIMYLLDSETTVVQWIFLTLVSGLGMGTLFSSMMLAVQASADPQFLSITAAMSAFFRALGQTMGVAIGGVVFQNRIKHEFSNLSGFSNEAQELSMDAAGLVKIIHGLPQGEARWEMESAYADALKIVWLFLCGLAGLALLASFFVKWYSMDQTFKPSQGVEMEGSRGYDTEEKRNEAMV
ncbi:MDR family MFS transporter [Aspergillus stella-maris]|uniref:MDR family MFS transporter n=1 Tax=Aspergillus stella-maris TaxID=1810926 RepID=UPI003CCE3168